MPFTISHAGFVIPLRRSLSHHVLLGLMIGSVVPDVAYFVRAFEMASFAHTTMGAVCVSLPVGFVLYLLGIACFRPLVDALPDPHSGLLAGSDIYQGRGRASAVAVAAAILAGALSHNFADSFTHEGGAAVSMFPALDAKVFSWHGEQFPVFRILQYAGSAIGMAMILGVYWMALRKHCRRERLRLWRGGRKWGVILGLAGATTVIAACLNVGLLTDGLTIYACQAFGFRFLITWMPLFGAMFVCSALIRFPPRARV